MFKAILHSKIGDQFVNLSAGSSWRDAYRASEDFLTAAVFGRLVYLPSEMLWSVIKRAVISNHDLPSEAGSLEHVDFWPNWELSLSERVRKQPDVFLRFTKVDLIVEAKRNDNSDLQSPHQWAEEKIAYLKHNESSLIPDNCYIFAVGGIANLDRSTIQNMKDEANRIINSNIKGTNIIVIACSWQMLLDSVLKEIENDQYDINKYLISDIVKIFEFHGIRRWQWLKDLPNMCFFSIKESSIEALSNWNRYKDSESTVTEPWYRKGSIYQPIRSSSLDVFRRLINE